MIAPHRWLPAVVLVLLALPGAAVAGCADDCSVDCGSGVIVRWRPGDVPEAPGYRLCVNGACESVVPAQGYAHSPDLSVAPAVATGDDEVEALLEAVGADGVPVASFAGFGSKDGRCCPSIVFRVRGGRLVEGPR